MPHAFTIAERYAVFTVHRERCWFCREPLSLTEMEVDHVIPESLENSEELGGILEKMGLPRHFRINGFENWRPAHLTCNRVKSDRLFGPSPLIQACLEEGMEKAPRAEEVAQTYVSNRKIGSAMHQLLAAHEQGVLGERQRAVLSQLVMEFHDEARDAEDRGKPLQLAPWLTVVSEDANFFVVKGPGGMVGRRPKGDKLHPSWDCPRCGPTGWDGARCVTCGMLDDGD